MFKTKPTLKNVSNVKNTISSSIKSKDLSDGLSSRNFKLDNLQKYGISGSIMGMAFDPVQSLMAISTDQGEIHIYGRERVEVVLHTNSILPIVTLKFVKSTYLVAIDTQNTLLVFSLVSKQLLHSYTAPGIISAIETDYSLDYVLIGLSSGAVVFFDVDRCALAPYRIDDLQRLMFPMERNTAVLSLKWHPRDFGTILVTYTRCLVIYSVTTGEIKQVFEYEVPAGAPGGDNIVGSIRDSRYPNMCNAIWHPNGLHIVSYHEDNSIVFWDANDGTLLQARTVFDIDVNIPGNLSSSPGNLSPIIKISWLCEENPEYTSLLICGGDSHDSEGTHTFTMLDFGFTPKYSLTSYSKMGEYYASPKQHKVLPIHTNSNIVDFLPLGMSSPYFNGNHNPHYVMVLMDDGDLKFMSYPTGEITYRSEFFPPSLSWINLKVTCSTATLVPRVQWLGMINSKPKGTQSRSILKGGQSAHRPTRKFELRSLLITGHEHGYLRIWDASQGELDDSSVLEVETSAVLASDLNLNILQVSFASETAELTFAAQNNDCLLFKFAVNKNYDPRISDLNRRLQNLSLGHTKAELIDISDRAPYHIKEGFLPVSLVRIRGEGAVKAIKNSNIGFVTITYESGLILVLDRRGPAIIFKKHLKELCGRSCYGTSVEFLITEVNDEGYSSIVMLVGTNLGDLNFFKLLPLSNGRFEVKYIDSMEANDSLILEIIGLNSDNGIQTFAKLSDMPRLSKGEIIPSLIITRSARDIRVMKSNKSKLSHRSFEGIATGGISLVRARSNDVKFSVVYSVLQKNSEIKILSLPSLSEFNSLRLPFQMDPTLSTQSVVLPSGDIVVRKNETEGGLVNIVGTGLDVERFEQDTLFNDRMFIPLRPTINTMQYFRGTKLIGYDDLIQLISGQDREESKTTESTMSWNLSPYNPANISAITGATRKATPLTSNTETDDDEFKYDKPIRKLGQGLRLSAPIKNVYRNFQQGIENLDEQGNEYANTFKDNMERNITEGRNTLITGLLKHKFGF